MGGTSSSLQSRQDPTCEVPLVLGSIGQAKIVKGLLRSDFLFWTSFLCVVFIQVAAVVLRF